MKKVSYLGLITVYGIFITLLSFRFVSAFFVDTANSTDNTFTAAAEFPSTPTPTGGEENPVATVSGTVVINEIMWMGSASSSADEWVELRNTTGGQITMTNWIVEQLGDGTPSAHIQFSGTIPANGFFLISNFNSTSASSILNVTPDIITSNVGLLDVGEQLVLKNDSNIVIDAANGNSTWLKGVNGSASIPNRSMERKIPPSDGTLVGNWQSSNGQVNLDSGIDFATPKASNSAGL